MILVLDASELNKQVVCLVLDTSKFGQTSFIRKPTHVRHI